MLAITDSERVQMELMKKWEGTAEKEKKGRAVQTVTLPKSESSVRVSLNPFMRPERKHREESVSHFRGNTGSRARSAQGEGERVGEKREEERESIVAVIPHPLS